MEDSLDRGRTLKKEVGGGVGRIDRYELVKELGGGGFACVYLARDTVAGIDVAVKGLPPIVRLNKEELENIRKNFALVSRLHHPNIAAALHLHQVEKAVYQNKGDAEKLRVFEGDTLVVMQYAPGVTLSRWRRQFPGGRVPFEKALAITRQIADALDYAHKEKVLHRDIKPANIMIETDLDGNVTARVLDFGLAAEIRSSMGRVSQKITDTSGTRPYMAPEQWLGEEQGKETDLYSLAVLFNELITGKVPFSSIFDTGDPVLMMNVVANREFNPPLELPKPIRRALAKALAKKREDRFASCSEFVDALDKEEVDGGVVDIDNLIVSSTPLPNLDVPNHRIERRGLSGFWGKFAFLISFSLVIGSFVSAYFVVEECLLDDYIYYNRRLDEYFQVHIDYNKLKIEDFRDKYYQHWDLQKLAKDIATGELCGDIKYYKRESCYKLLEMLGLILACIGLLVIAFFSFKICCRTIFARTQRLLNMFSIGSWNVAMNMRNVYLRDSFVLYYLGVYNLYDQKNYVIAEKQFTESADRGVPEALIGLGWMAENGWGKPQNKALAQKLYDEAKEKIEKRRENDRDRNKTEEKQENSFLITEKVQRVFLRVIITSILACIVLIGGFLLYLNYKYQIIEERVEGEKVQLWEGGPYWATKNIGAEKPEDSGYYFWWGDTVGYKQEGKKWVASDGSRSNFSFNRDNILIKTNGKSISELESEGWIEKKNGTHVLTFKHDAARAHWGGAWRMPTKEEFDDLNKKCHWTRTTRNGVNGYVVRGTEGSYAFKSIFLPCAGDGDGTSLRHAGSYGYYWSSVPYSDSRAWYIDSDGDAYCNHRNLGKSIRPLQEFTK
jgi:serine/threonine protein kinase/TPR repeat protein